MKYVRAVFGDSPPGQLGGATLLRFEGPGEPMPRRVDRKRKVKDRKRRKAARAQRRHMRGQ